MPTLTDDVTEFAERVAMNWQLTFKLGTMESPEQALVRVLSKMLREREAALTG